MIGGSDMTEPNRRIFLKELGSGAAGLSLVSGRASQLPGQPVTAGREVTPTAPANIMAIAAHPGDAFFTMGAAVALQIHLGARGVFVSLSLGERGSAEIAPEKYGELQRRASQRAAELLHAQTAFLTYRDGEIPASDEAKFALSDLIREHKPEVIVTHWRGSWHKDHQACHAIVTDAIFYAGLPAISRKLPAHAVPRLFFPENWEDAEEFVPDTYLDVAPVFERWIDACGAFPMWRGETGFRYNDYYSSLAVSRGCLSNNKYAVAMMSSPEQRVRHVPSL